MLVTFFDITPLRRASIVALGVYGVPYVVRIGVPGSVAGFIAPLTFHYSFVGLYDESSQIIFRG